MTMRLKLYTLLCISFLLIFTACNQDDDPVPAEKVTRTVLAYIMADNSLSGFASIDIDEMMKGMEAVDASLYNLLVYVDDASREGSQSYKFPTLYRLSKDKNGNVVKETVKEYKEQVSTDPAVMQEVLKRAFTEYPAESYGLVLWSHGEGWIPNPLPLAKQASTRWVGEDTTGGTTYLNISDIAAILSEFPRFDFILFDACFMGGVEVLYEMRHAAHYLIASPAEILGSGFPYDRIIPLIFSERLQLEEVCRQFMAYYRAQSGYNRSGSITLIRADQLDGLAEHVLHRLAAAARDVWSAGNLADVSAGEVQPFERMHTHKFFDLADYYSRLVPVPQYTDFDEQLSRTVLFSDYTDRIYSAVEYGSYGFFDVRTCCGLSTYIPQPGLPSHNEAYRSTAWALATGAGGQ